MTWDEAVRAMREGRMVRRPRMPPITLRQAQMADGKPVEVLVSAWGWHLTKVGAAARKRDDWELCTAAVE